MGLGHIFEEEGWRDGIHIQLNAGFHATGPGQGHHATLVGTHQRALGGSKRNVESSTSMFAIDQEGSRYAQGHLNRTDGVLYVPAHLLARNGAGRNVLQPGSGSFLHPVAPCGQIFIGVALVLQTRDQFKKFTVGKSIGKF